MVTGIGRSALLADRELPWLDERWRGGRTPRFAASMRPGLEMGGPTAE